MSESQRDVQQIDKPGTWPQVCVQRAFVEGAMWWMFKAQGVTPWSHERHEMEAEAVKRYGAPDAQKAGE